ncbi:interferon-induced GTP-binding protein Mx3-like [Protopterus annectens]|uniref:interferon-induced GTP-binding protein Mx3-like n=1 Tax=Protopterus annectens TaxID=7888 RepID=UPI001CFBD6F2|nr:interferon-induced GTP-binding protein Mx3-like [Protopterus annectens]
MMLSIGSKLTGWLYEGVICSLQPARYSVFEMDTSLYNHYEEKVRPCIDLIDSLRALGVEKDLALPAIAVIGDQSSGKSSVLEALSGVGLPRGSGKLMRCPIVHLWRQLGDDYFKGLLSYKDIATEVSEALEVETNVRKSQNAMAGSGKGISDKLISLEIESDNVPDLTLIDLPGIARVAVQGQPYDIGEQIKKLIRKFIEKEETINLVVVPCNVDIATTEALKMAQDVDQSGERTLGILTKPDLVDKGAEQNIVDVVNNMVIHLKKGYMIVKCRGQQDINENLTLAEATDKELSFFENHSHFSQFLEDRKATTGCLAERLTTELVEHINKTLTMLEEQIETKLEQTKKKLERYGEGVPVEELERTAFFVSKLTSFTQDIANATRGEDTESETKEKLFSVVREEFQKWKNSLDTSTTAFQKKMRKEVMVYDSVYRGRELPGFINYKTFESIVKDQIKHLETPAISTLKNVSEIVRKSFIEIAKNSFIGFPHLLRTAKTKIEELKRQQEEHAEAVIQTQFKMEQIIYAQDGIYSKSLSETKEQNTDGNKEPNSKKNSGFPFLVSDTVYAFGTSSNASVQEMSTHIRSYYTIAGQRLADQIPMIILHFVLREFAYNLHLSMLQLLQDRERMSEYLKEETNIARERKELRDRVQRLTQARHRLANFC